MLKPFGGYLTVVSVKPHSNSARGIAFDKPDPSLLKCRLYPQQGRYVAHRAFLAFDPTDGGYTDLCFLRKVALIPAQKGPRCTNLRGLEHQTQFILIRSVLTSAHR